MRSLIHLARKTASKSTLSLMILTLGTRALALCPPGTTYVDLPTITGCVYTEALALAYILYLITEFFGW